MAQATVTLAEQAEAPITLLYVRATAEADILGARLATIVTRYAPAVRLQVVTPDNMPPQFAEAIASDGPLPRLIVLRRGEIVSESCGVLPSRELDRAVRRAVEWPG